MGRFMKGYSIMKVALQLFTLREYIEKLGFDAVLGKVAALGYEGVEFANFGKLVPAEELRALLDKHGLEACSAHVYGTALTTELDKTIAYNKVLGTRDIVCSSAPMNNEEAFNATLEVLRHAGEVLRENGMQLHYHNHSPELWDKIGGECVFDRLFRLLPPEVILPEADVCWLHYGNVDPVEYTKKYGKFATRWHIKDAKGPFTRESREGFQFTPAGEGEVGIAEVVKAAKGTSIEWLIYENDDPVPEAFYAVGKSADALHAMLKD